MQRILMMLCGLALAACASGQPATPADPCEQPRTMQQYDAAPSLQIERDRRYTATFDTTRGSFEVELYANVAPLTVNNFVFLAREGYYDCTSFHRVIADFMIQGGDPTASGAGGPGYRFADEDSALALEHGRAGILSMANAGPNTNGSQFFITHKATPHLDGVHAVFGAVLGDGQRVVDAIRQGDTLRSVVIEED